MIRRSSPPGSPDRPAPPRPATAAVRLLALAAVSLLAAAPLDAQADSLRVAGDVSLHYELSGAGPPLVLIHGWTHDARVWELQTPELTREFTLLRYDRRGWGRSGGSPDVSMDPEDLDSLMAAVGLEDAHVVGHSQGANVALRFALAHPSRVRSVTLYGAPPPAGFGVPPVGEDTFPDMAAIVRDHGLDSLGAALFSHPLGSGFERGGRGLELAREMWATNARRAFEDRQPPSGATPEPSIDRVPEVTVPALVLTGEREMRHARLAADAVAYLLPDASRIEVPGGGHAVHLQEPERWTAEVLRFVRTVEEKR